VQGICSAGCLLSNHFFIIKLPPDSLVKCRRWLFAEVVGSYNRRLEEIIVIIINIMG
jgi:hypothetical protein